MDRYGIITLEGLTSNGTNSLTKTGIAAIYYDGLHFQEWTVTSEPIGKVVPLDLNLAAAPPEPAGKNGETWTDPSKKPAVDRRSMSPEERFSRVVSLFSAAVDDRLSILREEDEWEREVLLTTDIEDQIAHWEYIEKELAELKGDR